MPEIKPAWRQHPLALVGKVELVPTSWVAQFRGTDVSPTTTLKDGREVDLETLWDNILTEGLHDPVIIRVGVKNQMMRLEAGNHRIQLYETHRIPPIPTAIQLRDECGPHVVDTLNDGSHNFDARGKIRITSIPEKYLRPNEVFLDLPKT